jgi:hypothetical protein
VKSTDAYRVIRPVIAPWCKAEGFSRTPGGMLGWQRRQAEEHLVFWFQCSRDGWDDYAGSKFIVEFQLSEEPPHRSRNEPESVAALPQRC